MTSLDKGEKISLDKEAKGTLEAIRVGLGWKPRVSDGEKFDLDASAFVLDENGRCLGMPWFIYYGSPDLSSPDKSIVHSPDNMDGSGDGDDEWIDIDLAQLIAGNPQVKKIAIAVTIYKATERGQSFGQVADAYVRILDKNGDAELARYDLSEDGGVQTAMIFGEVYLNNGEWKFAAVGQGFNGGLAPLAESYGLAGLTGG